MLKQTCRFYNSAGKCRYGEQCRFSHEKTTAEPESVAGCKDKNSANSANSINDIIERVEHSSLHDSADIKAEDGRVGSEMQNGNPDQSDVKICEFYAKYRYCKFGKTCRFRHIRDGNSSAGKLKAKHNQTKTIKVEADTEQTFEDHSNEKKRNENLQNQSAKKTSKNICSIFKRAGYCRFGKRCRYLHPNVDKDAKDDTVKQEIGTPIETETDTKVKIEDHSNEEEQNKKIQNQSAKKASKKICQVFKQGYCRFGKRCRYLHSNIDGKDGSVKRESPLPTDGVIVKDGGTNLSASENKSAKSSTLVPRRPVVQPTRVINVYKRSEATYQQLLDLKKTEIMQLKKRFPSDTLQILEESDRMARFAFTFQPTDPDWPYDVKTFEIQVTIPEKYPMKRFEISLPCEQDLPETVRRYIEVTLEDWLREKDDERMTNDCVELSFRPFLRWLDRSMEEIVTEALKQLRRELTAQAAGLQFIPAGKLQHDPEQQQASSDLDQASCSDGDQPDEPDLIVYKKGEVEEEMYKGPSRSRASRADDSSEGSDVDSSDDDDDDKDDDDDDNDSSNKDSNSTSTTIGHQRPKIPLDTPRQGTEMSFRNLQLVNIATILVEKLRLSVQCERCRHNTDFNTPPNRVNSVACAKCHASQFVVFRPVLAHSYASQFGYLDVDGCSPLDVILQSCHMSVGCANCSQDILVKTFSPGHMMELFCRGCHNKIKFAAESVKLTKLAPSGLETISGKVYEVKVNSLRRVQKDPAIQEGRSLPNNGACKHYKKSFRWIRFPCCGKSYPCDVCHDSKEDHEMKFANRMICGFCCKEQPYASEKPCVGCGSALTKVRSSHWEGGRGCRDKISMSRSDNKKYANMHKTTSTKAKQLQEKQKGKKNTKLRHT